MLVDSHQGFFTGVSVNSSICCVAAPGTEDIGSGKFHSNNMLTLRVSRRDPGFQGLQAVRIVELVLYQPLQAVMVSVP